MLVSRVAFDAVCAARDAEHENAMQLRHDIAEWAKRYDDLVARIHELTTRIADFADNATKKPATIVTAPQPATEFKDFPPDVGAALAVANAGFRPDVVRANTLWAQQELARGEKSHVVAGKLMRGIPIPDDAMEA